MGLDASDPVGSESTRLLPALLGRLNPYRWKSVFAAAAIAMFWVLAQIRSYMPLIGGEAGAPSESVAMEVLLFACGSIASLVTIGIVGTIFSALRVGGYSWSKSSRYAMMWAGIGLLAAWQWSTMERPHPRGGLNGETPIKDGRLYVWFARESFGLSRYYVAYAEHRIHGNLKRVPVCSDSSNEKLVRYRVLDSDYLECFWSQAQLDGSHKEVGRLVNLKNGGQMGEADTRGHAPLMQKLSETEVEATWACRLEANPPRVQCGERSQALPFSANKPTWPMPKEWFIDKTEYTEITVENRKLLCMTAQVEAALPNEPLQRLPGLVFVKQYDAADNKLEVIVVYDTDAACERARQSLYSDDAFYPYSSLAARRGQRSSQTLLFPSPVRVMPDGTLVPITAHP